MSLILNYYSYSCQIADIKQIGQLRFGRNIDYNPPPFLRLKDTPIPLRSNVPDLNPQSRRQEKFVFVIDFRLRTFSHAI